MSQKILVVDDEPHILELVKYNLTQEGYEVLTAHDGAQAVTRARDTQPDLIILDIMLPYVDGLEVCRQIRRAFSVPIIMLTAKGGELERVVKENEARQLKILLINAKHEGVMAPLKEGNAAAKRGGNTTA